MHQRVVIESAEFGFDVTITRDGARYIAEGLSLDEAIGHAVAYLMPVERAGMGLFDMVRAEDMPRFRGLKAAFDELADARSRATTDEERAHRQAAVEAVSEEMRRLRVKLRRCETCGGRGRYRPPYGREQVPCPACLPMKGPE